MFSVDWDNLKETDLKDREYLEDEYGKFLRKYCKYSAKEARLVKDVIGEPFARNYCACIKTFVEIREVDSKTYEIFFCTPKDSDSKQFGFYTLVDVATKKEDEYNDELWPYIIAKKKFVLPNE